MLYEQDLSDYHPPAVPAVDVKTTQSTAPKDKEGAAIETSTGVPPSKADKTKPLTGSAGEFHHGYESVTSHPFRTMFFGLILLGVPISLFLWCGGTRWLRRVLRGRGKDRSKYKRVGDEDLEK